MITTSRTATYRPIERKNTNKLLVGLIVLIAILIGVIQVTQSGLNISLAKWSKHPLRAAFLNFFAGSIVLFPLFIFCKPKKSEFQDQTNNTNSESSNNCTVCKLCNNLLKSLMENKKNYLVFLNGSTGIIWILSAIYIAPEIGFGLYVISIILGQILASMLIDHFGLIWSKTKKLSLLNIFGACIALCGVIVFQIPAFESSNDVNVLLFVYILVSIFAGFGFTSMAALNRRLKNIMQCTPFHCAFFTFINAMLLLLIINIILYSIQDDWFEIDHLHLKGYIFFGGIGGGFVVSMYVICPSFIGFVGTYICSIFGSLITSLVYDLIGAFGVDQKNVSLLKLIGVICVLCGAIMVNIKRKKTNAVCTTELDDLEENEMDDLGDEDATLQS